MSFLEQTVDLFSQFPGSLIYHFVILFAIEAALGIALGYRQKPAARRLALAAGGILVGRLLLMALALLDSQDLIDGQFTILPPLERAVDAMGALLLVWALLPIFDKMSQWGNVLAGGGLFLLLVVYLFFAVAWYGQATGVAPVAFNSSSQDEIWTLIQLGLLGAAGVYSLFGRGRDWGLRFFVFAIPFGAHLAHFGWAAPGENVASWVRLGQLISYPLVTLSAYRLVFGRLLWNAARPPAAPAVDLETQVRQLAALSNALDEPTVLSATVSAVASATNAGTVALLSLGSGGGTAPKVISAYRDGQLDPDLQFEISLHDAPALRRAARDEAATFLRPGGKDDSSRLSLLMRLLPDTGLKARLNSSLYIQPLGRQGELYGMLLVQPAAGADDWPAKSRQLVDLLAGQGAAALDRLRAEGALRDQVEQLEEKADVAGHLGELGAELDRARETEQELTRRVGAARKELAQVKSDARKLAPLIKSGEKQRAQIAKLQRELVSMVEREQERASEISLEGLAPADADPEQVALAAQELRRPLASITGYTDLLLGESVGTVGELQRLFLQRVKASTERARVLLDDLVQATASEEPERFHPQPVQISELVEEMVQRLGDQIEVKGVRLQINLDDPLPPVEVDRASIERIITNLLSNALQATPAGGQVAVDVRYQADDGIGAAGNGLRASGYLFVSVHDSGSGVGLSDLSNVFDRHYRSANPPIIGLGETDLGLPLVKDLLQAQGGRIWIESETDVGSTLSMVLPAAVVQL